MVEPCFSQMRALVGEISINKNYNVGIYKGCRAGVSLISINIDGTIAPCRHLLFSEAFDTIEDYFKNSKIIRTINNLSRKPDSNCITCRLQKYCRPCLAVNLAVSGNLTWDAESCSFKDL